MSRAIRVALTPTGVSVNGKHLECTMYLPPNRLDADERKALALFSNRKTKIQSSIITL